MSVARVGRKWPAIDILAIYSKGDANGWNRFLHQAYMKRDVEGLKKTLYGVQAGMADLSAKKLSDEKIHNWFIRLQRSIENTAKDVFRAIYPHPLDQPLNGRNPEFLTSIHVKRKRDQEFEKFLKESRF